jgi:tetratricopeptide (TPR) repeat protein
MTLSICTIADTPRSRSVAVPVVSIPFSGDFAADRNVLLQKASTDWVLMLDDDETVKDWDMLIAYTEHTEPIPTRLIIENTHDEYLSLHSAYRLLPNDPRIRYQGTIHEQPQLDGFETAFLNTRIRHTGYEKADPDKWERNYVYTKAWIENSPGDAMAWYHYATLMMQKYRWHDAIKALGQAVNIENPVFQAAKYNKYSLCFIHLDDIPLAKEYIGYSLDITEWQVKAWYHMHLIARMTENTEVAVTSMLRMMQCEYYIRNHGLSVMEDVSFSEAWYKEQMEEL